MSYSLVHKFTLKNVSSLYRDDWGMRGIQSNEFYSQLNDQLRFYVVVYPNGYRDEDKGNLSMFLCYSSDVDLKMSVRCNISIIDGNRNKQYTRGMWSEWRVTGTNDTPLDDQEVFNPKQPAKGYHKYISVSKLRDKSNGYLDRDTLTLCCEVSGKCTWIQYWTTLT